MSPKPMLFLTILEGPSPAEAVPIFSTHDPKLIQALAQALVSRLGGAPSTERVPGRVLALGRRGARPAMEPGAGAEDE